MRTDQELAAYVATDAPVQIRGARAAVSLGARTRTESLPGRPTSTAVGAPPIASDAGVRRMGCGDLCLLNDEGHRTIEGSSRPLLINLTAPAGHTGGSGYTVGDASQRGSIIGRLGAQFKTPTGVGVLMALVLTAAWAVLHHEVATPRGLTRSLYLTSPPAGQPIHEDTRVTVDLESLEQITGKLDLPATFAVRWVGYWFAVADDRVSFRARTDSRVSVFLDGELVLQHDAAVVTAQATSTHRLTPGVHQLVIDYDYDGEEPELNLLWAPSGAQPRPVGGELLLSPAIR